MGGGTIPRIPAEEKTIRRSHIDELRTARVGDILPRGDGIVAPEGVVTPGAGSLGAPDAFWDAVYAKEYFDATGAPLLAQETPQFPNPRVLAGPSVPGSENAGSCGHLTFSTDKSYLYLSAGTLLVIDFLPHEVGYAATETIPNASRISTKPTFAGSSPAEARAARLVGDGWWYDSANVHSPLADGDADTDGCYSILANSDSRLFLGKMPKYGVFTKEALLNISGFTTEGDIANVASDGHWYRYDGTTWQDTDYALVGAVAFKNGAISKIFSVRTQVYLAAVLSIALASAVVGVDTGVGTQAVNAYTGTIRPYFRSLYNRFAVYNPTQATVAANRIAGAYRSVHTATDTERDVDHLFYGVLDVYGWADNVGRTLTTSFGTATGIHVYLPARVILSVTFTGSTNEDVRFVPGFYDGKGIVGDIPRYPTF